MRRCGGKYSQSTSQLKMTEPVRLAANLSPRPIQLRRFPYPYRAMLAVCSDLDETPDLQTYLSISQYLNTSENTAHGRGVDLEVGNTIFFNMPPGEFAYWNAANKGRDMLRRLIKSGHIDCFHSYGDCANTRDDAKRCLDELEAHDCRLRVWVDHAKAASNFGSDIMSGHGDIPGDDAYHADLTVQFGVRYVWLGRVTSVIGQDTSYRPLSVLRRSTPLKSSVTAAKDLAKRLLSVQAVGKYSLHRGNRLLRQTTLRDGQCVVEFMRCNPNPGGISVGDHSQGIADALAPNVLDQLVACGGASIIYTHLGKRLGQHGAFYSGTREAFERLGHYSQAGKILVCTTYRLLNYKEAVQSAQLSVQNHDRGRLVDVVIPKDCDPGGLTFYAEDDDLAVRINGIEIRNLARNPPDETGKQSFSVEWRSLEWSL